MKNLITRNLTRLSLILILIFMASFIFPGNTEKSCHDCKKECSQKIPFLFKFSGIHFKGHLCSDNGIRSFHDINIEIISTSKHKFPDQQFASQNAVAAVFLNWQ